MNRQFIRIFDKPEDFQHFLSVNPLNCVKYDIMDGRIIALFDREDEVILATKEGKIFYSGLDDFWTIALAIENIVMQGLNSFEEEYGINAKNEILAIGKEFLSSHNLHADNWENMHIMIDEITMDSEIASEKWNEMCEEFYHDLRHLFEL